MQNIIDYIRAVIITFVHIYRRDEEIEVTSVVEGEGEEDEHNRERDEASGSDDDVIDEDIQKKGPKKGKKQPKKEPKGEDNYIRVVERHYICADSITFVHIFQTDPACQMCQAPLQKTKQNGRSFKGQWRERTVKTVRRGMYLCKNDGDKIWLFGLSCFYG